MGVTAAVVIGVATAASVGASVYAANKQASTARNAANTQSAAADRAAALDTQARQKALDLQADIYNRQQENLAPYRAIGTSAGSNLMARMGLPSPTAGTSSTPVKAPTAGGGPYSAAPTAGNDSGLMPNQDTGRVRPRMSLSDMSPGMVTMRAPDGTTQQVPRAQMQHWMSKGATLVSGGSAYAQ